LSVDSVFANMQPYFRGWSHEPPGLNSNLKRMSVENHEEQTRDGFTLTRKVYVPTHDTSMMDPVSKRKATICNLFASHRMPLKDIARVRRRFVRIIHVIVESGLVYDRRKKGQCSSPTSAGNHTSRRFRPDRLYEWICTPNDGCWDALDLLTRFCRFRFLNTPKIL
jgi:hypothetical protein